MSQAGGFDKLLLDSLYEDDNARRQHQLQMAGYGHGGVPVENPFDHYNQQHDPFAMSSNIAPPTNVQLALLAQQQQQHQMMYQQPQQQQQHMMFQPQHHNMMMVPHPQHTQYPHQMQSGDPNNPFGDPLPVPSYPHSSLPQQGNYNLM